MYDFELCRQLCKMAGLSEKWEAADGETFESVLWEAKDILSKKEEFSDFLKRVFE